ncbi:hypothetical protein EB38_01656 [Enterococcus faecalis]|nr:hypothetical protein EB38_01656 [Enterococcus faecalis]
MIELILLLSVILLGLLIGNKRMDKWLFLKALLLFSVMLSVSILISVAMYLLLTIGVANVIGEQLESLFLLGIVVIISTSLLLYFLLNLTTKKIVLPIALMKIIEYYIQWVLIYVTIYQVIFDQFIVSSEVKIRYKELSMSQSQSLLLFCHHLFQFGLPLFYLGFVWKNFNQILLEWRSLYVCLANI